MKVHELITLLGQYPQNREVQITIAPPPHEGDWRYHDIEAVGTDEQLLSIAPSFALCIEDMEAGPLGIKGCQAIANVPQGMDPETWIVDQEYVWPGDQKVWVIIGDMRTQVLRSDIAEFLPADGPACASGAGNPKIAADLHLIANAVMEMESDEDERVERVLDEVFGVTKR